VRSSWRGRRDKWFSSLRRKPLVNLVKRLVPIRKLMLLRPMIDVQIRFQACCVPDTMTVSVVGRCQAGAQAKARSWMSLSMSASA
jgi:hypothetical protein